ncbi:hypothetical protein DM01DRAFT_1339555 [Hesseltinella vesiculosa]|uniref:Uncharacterized protein n=1 Tax=Hesseltinella vesiculosa TaxID=101127 RepID=A0A1X2G6X9_9FUNG|nr:hypothetical protein DM01DRAFT_1339555 [Hesseltinella vesiculosa]
MATITQNRNATIDMDKHIESLKTRLGFARFKLRNGWENNTLIDVECFWKEKQRQMIDALPTPRFTQRDILDNRTLHPHYHYQAQTTQSQPQLPYPTLPQFSHVPRHQRRHSHQHTKRKRSKLTRSLSSPITSPTSSSFMTSPSPPAYSSRHPLHKRTSSCSPSPEPYRPYPFHSSQPELGSSNSLHYLSYAIDMTENRRNDSASPMSQDEPPSPETAAAEAMIMFGHQTQ